MKRFGIVAVLCVLVWLASAWGHGGMMAQSSVGVAPGTPTQDLRAQEQAEIQAKMNRIKADPEAYRKQGGDPESVLGPKEEAPEARKVAPAFVALDRFLLEDMVAVAASGVKPSAEDLDVETKNASHDFPKGKLVLSLGENGAFQLADGGKMDVRGIAKSDGNQLEWYMGEDDCPTCKKIVFVTILESGPQRLVYLVKGEDENSQFDYKMTFTRISTSK